MKEKELPKSLTNKRALLVDDDASLLHLLSLRLIADGLEVRAVESAEQALAQLPVFRPHVVITDLRMQGMDGLSLFTMIDKQHTAMPVIIMTAHGTIEEAVDATKRGVFSFITKPFDSKDLLQQINQALRVSGGTEGEEDLPDWRAEIITRSPVMEDLLRQVKLVSQSDASVFIHGESGTGKELLARAIHNASPREGAFVPVNCSAIPESLFESELFGHRKGAFTGATHTNDGLFKSAEGGTLFLDEIGDMPKAFQAKLLRALQERQIRPVGATESMGVDVRIVSATHRNLEEAMLAGEFREDLYYRLNVVTLELIPLSKRREDIPLLVTSFLRKLAEKSANQVRGYSPEAMEILVTYDWPGNVRQLYNVVEQTVALSTTPIIPETLVTNALRDHPVQIPSLVEARQKFDRDYLVQLLQLTCGNVSHAARLAKRNRTEFYKLLNRYHINPSLFKIAR